MDPARFMEVTILESKVRLSPRCALSRPGATVRICTFKDNWTDYRHAFHVALTDSRSLIRYFETKPTLRILAFTE